MTLMQLSGPVVLDIPTDPASLFLVRGLVERLTQRMDFPKEEIDRIILAVDEACTNVIRHAYRNQPDKRIVLTFEVSADRLEIRIRDFGTACDPACFKSRSLNDVRPGGLGLHFIRSAMDEVVYDTPDGGGMLLKLLKYRTREEVPEK